MSTTQRRIFSSGNALLCSWMQTRLLEIADGIWSWWTRNDLKKEEASPTTYVELCSLSLSLSCTALSVYCAHALIQPSIPPSSQATFMMPSYQKRLVYRDPPYPAWPDDWMDKYFVPIPNGKGHWAAIIETSSVQFSFAFLKSKRGLKIPKRVLAGIRVATKNLSRAPAREESDQDGLVDSGDEGP